MIRVVLPAHLRALARVNGEVELQMEGQVTQRSVLDALEPRYPMLRASGSAELLPPSIAFTSNRDATQSFIRPRGYRAATCP